MTKTAKDLIERQRADPDDLSYTDTQVEIIRTAYENPQEHPETIAEMVGASHGYVRKVLDHVNYDVIADLGISQDGDEEVEQPDEELALAVDEDGMVRITVEMSPENLSKTIARALEEKSPEGGEGEIDGGRTGTVMSANPELDEIVQ